MSVLTLWNFAGPAWLVAAIGLVSYLLLFVRRASMSQVTCFVAATGVFLVATVSPIAALARTYLFTAHMLQHLLLLLIVPMLMLLALPETLNPGRHRRRGYRGAGFLAIVGWISGIGAMWLWHVPALCDASLKHQRVFVVQTASLIGAGLLFWRPIYARDPGARLSPLNATVYLFSACVGCTLLGIYVTFSPVSVCPVYHHPVDSLGLLWTIRNRWGLSFAADQQLGGLLMWVPACTIYLSVILAMLSRWYRADSPTRRPEHVTT